MFLTGCLEVVAMNSVTTLEHTSIQLAQTLWHRLSPQQKADYMVLVYRILLNRYPVYKNIFPKELETVRDHMTDTINYLVQHLEYPEKMKAVFDCLGAKHQQLGIKPEMFPHMVECKVEALREFFGGTLSQDDLKQWEKVMSFLANSILQAYPE